MGSSRYIMDMENRSPSPRRLPTSVVLTALVPVAMLLMTGDAHAAGIFDSVANTFKSLESTWYGRLFGDARDLFTLLAGIEFAWLGAQWMLARRTFDEIVPSLLKKVIVIGFFLAILLNANTWVTDVLNSFQVAGSQAGGLGALSPSTVMSYGISDAWGLLTGANTGGGGGGFFSGMLHAVKDAIDPAVWLEILERILLAALILLAFFAIAIEMLVTLIESYLVLGAGVLFLAFGASRWTTKFADGYLNNAVAIGVKLFTIYLIVGGLTTSIIPQMNAQLNSVGNGGLLSGLTAAVVMLAAAMIAKRVPEKAASFLGGGISMTSGALGAEVGRAGALAAGVGAAAFTGGTAALAGGAATAAGAGAGSAAGMAGAQASTLGGAAMGAAGSGGGVAASSGAAGVAAPGAAPAQAASAAGGASPSAGASPGVAAPAPASPGQGATSQTPGSAPAPSAGGQSGNDQAAGQAQGDQQQPAQTRTGQRLQDTLRSMQQAARGLHGAAHGSHSGVQASHISTSHGHDG